MRIGKVCFGKDDFQYGLELCLKNAGRTAAIATPATASYFDVLLMTAFWHKDWWLFYDFQKRAGISKYEKKPLIIIGGMQATLAPESFSALAHYVFIGDGDWELKKILDDIEQGRDPESKYLYNGGGTIPEPCEVESIGVYPMHKGGRRDVVRIEVARGCPYKCAFCALSGLKKYREAPTNKILNAISESYEGGNKVVSCFAPDRQSHSGWEEIQSRLQRHKIHNLGMDARVERLPTYKKKNAVCGVEGLSHKLRKLVGKSWTDEKILDYIDRWQQLNDIGILYLGMYFIADLPGEEEKDWEEGKIFFEKLNNCEWSSRLNMSLTMIPFSPRKFTRLADAIVHPFRDYETKWRLIENNNGKCYRFRVAPSMLWGAYDRIQDNLVQRGGAGIIKVADAINYKYWTKRPKLDQRIIVAKEMLKIANENGITNEKLQIKIEE
jgi:radical SAM superfamily enzyme YgiQ (UPF0313 family)